MMTRRLLFIAVLLVAAPAAAQSGNSQMLDAMRAADTNGDGMITRDELLAARAANFTRFDRNGDGMLSEGDIPGFVRNMAMGKQFLAMIVQFDRNGDRKVSRDEFVSGPTPVFDRADTNHDSRLTRTELDAAVAIAKAGL